MSTTTLATPVEQPRATRGQILSWTLFDFANTGFSVMMVTFAFPLYFRNVIAGGNDFYWGLAVSLSMLLCALIAPPMGAAADSMNGKKQFLLLFTLTSILATAALFFVGYNMLAIGMLLFIIANVGFEGGIVFYDAMLPSLATERSTGRVSGYGFAMGYAGSLAIIAICTPLIINGWEGEYFTSFRLSFIVVAAFFLLFALPLFLFVPEKKHENRVRHHYIREGFRRSWTTLSHIRQYPNIARFLLAFFIYNDAILTVISFASIYAESTLHFSIGDLITFFLTVQTTAIVGSLVFGFISDKIGAKKTITITLFLWIIVVVVAYFAVTKQIFYGVGLLAGLAIGSSQSASRSLMTKLTPKERAGEFFGFYDGFFGKASAIIGPITFGWLSSAFGQRPAIVFLSTFFIAGLFLLAKVKEEDHQGQKIAG